MLFQLLFYTPRKVHMKGESQLQILFNGQPCMNVNEFSFIYQNLKDSLGVDQT